MPTTGIYFLAAAPNASSESFLPSQIIYNALTAEHQLEPLPNWTMEHRLFRETNLGANNTATGSATGYLQMLNLSHHSNRSYVGISKSDPALKSGETASSLSAVIVVPPGIGNEEFYSMLTSRFTPLWQRRQVMQVGNGQAHEAGAFKIRLGEVREVKAGQSSGAGPIRGTVIEITTNDESEGSANQAIRQFWAELDIPDAKEFMRRPGPEDEFGPLRTWLEALRIRA